MVETTNEVPTIGEEDDLTALLDRWDALIASHWGEWAATAEEDFKFVSGDQWEDDDIEKMRDLQRTYITFNYTEKFIDAVAGSEIMNRQEIKYQPQQVGDSGVSEILSGAAEWVREQCDAEHEESEAFKDALICGIGVTSYRMEYDIRPEGQIIKDHIDPLLVRFDPASRKANFADARYLRVDHVMSRGEFEEKWPEANPDQAEQTGKRVTIVEPEQRYHNGMLSSYGDEVQASEYQFYRVETFYELNDPETGEPIRVAPDQYEPIEAQYREATKGGSYGGVKTRRRVYYKLYRASGRILPDPQTGEMLTRLDVDDFTYKAITGKRDRKRGTWYGLTRAMKDPQRYGNMFLSMVNHYLKHNAKGGVMVEQGAIDDMPAFEASYAASDAVTTVPEGVISGNKVMPKPVAPYPTALGEMMNTSMDAIPSVTGINLELLGQADRDQPGILEQQRKQAAYGILASFFDSKRRYTKEDGRLLLRFIQEYVPQGTLVRIEGEDGKAQFVPLVYDPQVSEYHVIVDESPAGPNQKQQNFQLLLSLIQVVGPENIPTEIWPEVVRNSPLSVSLVDKLNKALKNEAETPPSPEQQLGIATGQAKVRDLNASAASKEATAARTAAETQMLPVQAQLDAADMAIRDKHETAAQLTARIAALSALLTSQSQPTEQFP